MCYNLYYLVDVEDRIVELYFRSVELQILNVASIVVLHTDNEGSKEVQLIIHKYLLAY